MIDSDPKVHAKLSVIIVSYNVKYYLEQCLISLKQSLHEIKSEIFVVDNASIDGSVDYISSRFPEVFIIESGANPVDAVNPVRLGVGALLTNTYITGA